MGKHKKWVQLVIFAAVLLIGGLTLAGNLFQDNKKPVQGDKAPDFTLVGMDGKTHKLSDYKGKTVLLNFWGTFCPPCKDEMPAMQQQYEQSKREDIEFLAVNLAESPITVQNFVTQYKLSFPILLDDKEEIRKRYGVINYPTTFFIGPDGRIASVKVGQMTEDFLEHTVALATKKP
ncbi:thiol-disulfide oxidoreductase ResA [Paenibacillus thalictri]|uniref:Thiol-disulfide oxidoreductase ResA n=1 Tax=Paenibacillus thalictri TaxID=2527873 RepID=A0A4Q9DVR8_9BACL|nr:thiol-disulfide oxidoreductase ResA [Paenibacillus thalictri]TBL79788.1 thiol-disulfide oxidoreductase ResA [Paenibacillus thalictri]